MCRMSMAFFFEFAGLGVIRSFLPKQGLLLMTPLFPL